MIRWRWIAAVALGVLLGIAAAERLEAGPAGVHVTGTLGGPDTDGGYFELQTAQGASQHEVILATPIDSPYYPALKALVGRSVQVSVFVP